MRIRVFNANDITVLNLTQSIQSLIMTSSEYSQHFSINNLPFGIASSPQHPNRQCVTRLENTVIFLAALQKEGLLDTTTDLPKEIFASETLNPYAALPRTTHISVRQTLQNLITENRLPASSTADLASEDITLHLPISIPTFTGSLAALSCPGGIRNATIADLYEIDFSCSKHHVQNAGRAIIDNPAPPPGFFHFPIGYTGRASSIVVSGSRIYRPKGHFVDRDSKVGEKPVVYAPSRAMDYELEIGAVIGRPVERGRVVSAAEAEEHVFGLIILNDWSGMFVSLPWCSVA